MIKQYVGQYMRCFVLIGYRYMDGWRGGDGQDPTSPGKSQLAIGFLRNSGTDGIFLPCSARNP